MGQFPPFLQDRAPAGIAQCSSSLSLLVQFLAMIPVKNIFRVQAGCQACGQDLDCPTEQGAERQPGLMSDWDMTTRAA